MEEDEKRNLFGAIFIYILKYISYIFLAHVVIFSVASLVFPLLAFKIDFSFGFLKHLSFINLSFGQDSFSAGTAEIMQVYGVLSFIVWGLVFLSKKTVEKLTKKELTVRLRDKITIGLIILSLMLIIDITGSFFIPLQSRYISIIIFLIFYISAAISLAIHAGIQYFISLKQ